MIPPKKSLGQNFLADSDIARRIVDSVAPSSGDLVVEIGPGTGALTRRLVAASGYVVAVEVDSRLVAELHRVLKAGNLSVVEADALRLHWEGLLESATESWRKVTGQGGQPRIRVVANLPYYISTPIIERLIGLRTRLSDMTLMLQKEVVERIVSPPGSRDYGYLSVLVQFHCVATMLFEVPPEAFQPAPKVESAVLRLSIREHPAVEVADAERFFALVRAAFAQRRKTIANNLKAARLALGLEDRIDTALERASIQPMRRAETLSIEEFARLDHALFEGMEPQMNTDEH